MELLAVLITLVLVFGAMYLTVAGLTWLVCLAFGLPWSWLIALGVFAFIALARMVFSITVKGK